MKVGLIGAGNVATHLGKSLVAAGYEVVGVFSRNIDNASTLTAQLQTGVAINNLSALPPADLFFLCISDDAIASVAKQIAHIFPTALLVHTAGSVPLSTLSDVSTSVGVIYPLQTFSKTKPVDFYKVPLFVEASDTTTETLLFEIASKLSYNVKRMNSMQRQTLHLAAVFACNFTNHCYALAADILTQEGLSFTDLLPLIEETTEKIHHLSPLEAQTGPAVRWNTKVISRQEQMLSGDANKLNVYQAISHSIQSLATGSLFKSKQQSE